MNIIEYKESIIGKVYKGDDEIPLIDFALIREDELDRVDRFSKRIYGDDVEFERLLKVNNIQDPFRIEERIFDIVSNEYINGIFIKPKPLLLSSKISSISETLNQNDISKIDSKRHERISKILYKFGEVPTELRKPIYLKTDENNLIVENGMIRI